MTLKALAITLGLVATVDAIADPAQMPLLTDDAVHLYTVRAFEFFEQDVRRAVDRRYEELIDAGMDTGRHLFDWRDLEPAPGVYDRRLVIDAMDDLTEQGIRFQFPDIVIIDSGGPEVPAHIEALIADGAPWDAPQIVQAFNDLLDVFVPLMLERGMFALSLSNEPGGYYEDEPALAATFQGLIEAAVARAHLIEPDLATTVVFAGPEDAAIADLMPLLDVASFNTYIYSLNALPNCTFEGVPIDVFRIDRAGNVGTYLDALIAAADGKLINIQEIGQATEGNTLGPRASEANQAAVYGALTAALDARREQIRTVCNWTLNDHERAWDPLAAALVADGLPVCFARNIRDIFSATGLVRSDAVATPKASFEIFKRSVARLREPQ